MGNKVWRKPPPSLWTEAYDPSKHGFWMVKGQLMYIYADGRRQLAGAVNVTVWTPVWLSSPAMRHMSSPAAAVPLGVQP